MPKKLGTTGLDDRNKKKIKNNRAEPKEKICNGYGERERDYIHGDTENNHQGHVGEIKQSCQALKSLTCLVSDEEWKIIG